MRNNLPLTAAQIQAIKGVKLPPEPPPPNKATLKSRAARAKWTPAQIEAMKKYQKAYRKAHKHV